MIERRTLLALAIAAGAALAASLLAALGVPPSTAAGLTLVIGAWGALAGLLAYLFVPRVDLPWRQLRGVGGGRLALTIDDGPHPDSTPALLDALRAAGVRATFFLVGAAVEQWPELARRIVEEGHAIGNHTMRHRLLPFRTAAQLEEEIAGCQRVLGDARWFRPPHGFKPIGLHRLLRRHGLRLVAWHGAIRDTDGPGAPLIVERALRIARGGRILLLHDNPSCRGQTAAALPEIVAGCRARGLTLVTLDEIAASPATVGSRRSSTALSA
jgi:peptidoglycan/xylan/chitin deacetylase (PgdA/CDA1 family)